MCGIFGEIAPARQRDSSTAQRVSDTLIHRGPDAAGLDEGDGWMLGFRRLAILDLHARANQPMRSPDGRKVLVFNGEIYNYLELRKTMEEDGERFATTGDVEVLLRLLMHRGSAALPLLNGMFAFVYLDLDAGRFLIARDRFGVKPLYLQDVPGRLRFASELRALTAWPDARCEPDLAALRQYLSLGYVPGDACVWQGYVKLPPGHLAEGRLDEPDLRPTPWWSFDIEPAPAAASPEALLEELDALLAEATAIRTRSDVPTALLLSGGIDSGLVGAFLARSQTRPLALVAGFDEKAFDETALARATAEHLGLDMRVMPLAGGNLGEVDRVAAAFDEPFGDSSALPMLHICRAARESATVLMSGDGGDEAFAGYRRYLETRRFRALLALPDGPKRLAWQVGRGRLPAAWAYRLAKATVPSDRLAAAFDGLGLARDPAVVAMAGAALGPLGDLAASTERTWTGTRGHDLLSRQRLFDYRQYLPDDVLVKVDRASMRHSTEVRSPFLDYRVAEFAARLPQRCLIANGEGKAMLRRLADRLLPPQVARARKSGFGVPVGAWIRSRDGAALVRERLTDPARNPHHLWNPRGVETVLTDHLAGRRDCGEALWRLLVLESWLAKSADAAPGMSAGDRTRPLRVAMLTQRYLPFTGGAELQLAAVLRRLPAEGVQATVITRRHDRSAPAEEIGGIAVRRLAVPGPRPVASLLYTGAALAALHRFRPDVVHAFELLSPSTTALAYKAMTGVPVVAKVLRGGSLGDVAVLQGSRSGRLRLPGLMRRIDAFAVISDEIDRELAALGVEPSRRHFIPNGVDLAAFPLPAPGEKAALRRRLQLPGGPLALFLGRMEHEKRADRLAALWPRVRASVPGASLTMLGTGSLEAPLRSAAPEGVLVQGVRRDVRDWYAAADAFVLPSQAEGLSNALLEAMAMGLPCVVTRVGAAPDLITPETGRLVDVDHDEALVGALIDTLSSVQGFDPNLPRTKIEAGYSLDSTAGRLARLYRSLVQQ